MLHEILTKIRPEIYVAVGALIFAYIIGKFVRYSRSNLPPGPIGLPVLGYIPFLSKYPHLDFVKLAEKYGEVFSVRLGSRLIVVLNGTKSIREAFSKNELLARPDTSSFSIFGNKSPFFQKDVHIWQEQRRFVVQSMKDLGLGKTKIEDEIQEEINHFLDKMKEYDGQPVDMKPHLTPSASNNICALVFGHRFEYDHPDRLLLDRNVEEVSKAIGQTASHIFFPWISKLPFLTKLLSLEKALKLSQETDNFFKQKIKEHEETLDPRNIRDFIDSYLVEMKTRQLKDPKTSFTDETLIGNIGDLFGAGTETVRSSILWCVYVLASYPEVQKKVQKEIMDVLGPDRSATFLDLKEMPYTHAVILEIMRWKTVVPLNILRSSLSEITIGGYTIPKNTMVLANLYAPHHDPKSWDNPEIFKPERFLTPEGKVSKPNSYMPFSIGKRACPGETMAYMEIFLYSVSILQKFNIAFPDGFKPTFETEPAITNKLKSYKVRLLLKDQ